MYNGNRALVVEGESILRDSLVMQLEALGFAVAATRNADEALKLLQAAPDMRLMVVDRNVSGQIGAFELVAAASAIAPSLSVVITSGFSDSPPNGPTANSQWTLLRKPFSWSEFKAVIRDTLAA